MRNRGYVACIALLCATFCGCYFPVSKNGAPDGSDADGGVDLDQIESDTQVADGTEGDGGTDPDRVETDTQVTCENECDSLGAQKCAANVLQKCQVGSDGCNDFVDIEDCAENGQICNDSKGTPACVDTAPLDLVSFNGSSTGWTTVDPDNHIQFRDNRLEWTKQPRNVEAAVYTQVSNMPDSVIIEYTFMETFNSFKGCTCLGVLGNDLKDRFWNMQNGMVTNEIYRDGHTGIHSISALTTAAGSISEGNEVAILPDTQYWVRGIVNNGSLTTTIFSDPERTKIVGASTLNVRAIEIEYVFLFLSLGDPTHLDTQSGWIADFRVREYR